MKNIKLPFFSHNKSESVKGKKEKKRKLYGFNKLTKEKSMPKPIDENSQKHNLVRDTVSPYKYYKMNKRSYLERLCPACKRKFLMETEISSEDKRREVLDQKYSTTDNREIFDRKNNLENDAANEFSTFNTFNAANPVFDEEDSEEYVHDRRKRQEDNRNIERQRELEDLERRVDSVTVRGPYTKVETKV